VPGPRAPEIFGRSSTRRTRCALCVPALPCLPSVVSEEVLSIRYVRRAFVEFESARALVRIKSNMGALHMANMIYRLQVALVARGGLSTKVSVQNRTSTPRSLRVKYVSGEIENLGHSAAANLNTSRQLESPKKLVASVNLAPYSLYIKKNFLFFAFPLLLPFSSSLSSYSHYFDRKTPSRPVSMLGVGWGGGDQFE